VSQTRNSRVFYWMELERTPALRDAAVIAIRHERGPPEEMNPYGQVREHFAMFFLMLRPGEQRACPNASRTSSMLSWNAAYLPMAS